MKQAEVFLLVYQVLLNTVAGYYHNSSQETSAKFQWRGFLLGSACIIEGVLLFWGEVEPVSIRRDAPELSIGVFYVRVVFASRYVFV